MPFAMECPPFERQTNSDEHGSEGVMSGASGWEMNAASAEGQPKAAAMKAPKLGASEIRPPPGEGAGLFQWATWLAKGVASDGIYTQLCASQSSMLVDARLRGAVTRLLATAP
jgi:hypothetical protein